MVGRRTCDQEVASSIPDQARLRTTTLGKLFTPNCLDADTLRYSSVVKTGHLYLYHIFQHTISLEHFNVTIHCELLHPYTLFYFTPTR